MLSATVDTTAPVAVREVAAVRVDDPFELERFVRAQDDAGTYRQALAELRAGRKRSHWIWFVFPQPSGLGCSPNAVRYAVTGMAEARAYLEHPVLGRRLVQCSQALLDLPASDAEQVMGSPLDARKLHSSMTLFARVDSAPIVFERVLEQYFDGAR